MEGDPGLAAWPVQASNKANLDRIGRRHEYDWY